MTAIENIKKGDYTFESVKGAITGDEISTSEELAEG